MRFALVGAYPQTRLQAPFYGDWEIWATGPSNRNVLPRFDAWFEIHSPSHVKSYDARACNNEYIHWLKTLPRVYMQKELAGYQGAIKYPRREIVDLYGPYFFTSGIAWMIALALTFNPEEIGLWGIEMVHPEYIPYRPALHHFVQIARDRGICVTAPLGSTILDPLPLYGFDGQ